MKTNKEKNIEHDRKELLRVRPKQAAYDFKPLGAVIRQWITGNQ
jgi:hypothetical protein